MVDVGQEPREAAGCLLLERCKEWLTRCGTSSPGGDRKVVYGYIDDEKKLL